MIQQAVSRNGALMAVFALITTGLVVLVATLTKPAIDANRQSALRASLLEVVQTRPLDAGLIDNTYPLPVDPLLGNREPQWAWVAKQDNKPVAVILPVTAPDGYGGSINLLLGITVNGHISGVRVIPPHYETPGLGDKIELQKSNWILSFNGKSLTNPAPQQWAVRKDGGVFDAFTGATITPRAVVQAVYKGLQYFTAHKGDWLALPKEDLAHVEH